MDISVEQGNAMVMTTRWRKPIDKAADQANQAARRIPSNAAQAPIRAFVRCKETALDLEDTVKHARLCNGFVGLIELCGINYHMFAASVRSMQPILRVIHDARRSIFKKQSSICNSSMHARLKAGLWESQITR